MSEEMPSFVYKYLSSERVTALAQATLRATQPTALNDPFELRPTFDIAVERSDIEEALRDGVFLKNAFREAYDTLPPEQRNVMTFEQLMAIVDGPAKKAVEDGLAQIIEQMMVNEVPAMTNMLRAWLFEKLAGNVGIISFSETPDDVLMWSHYANDHRGFVIEFDARNKFFESPRTGKDEFFRLRRVAYNEPPTTRVRLTDHDGTTALCTKHPRWSYEREWRMLIPIAGEKDAAKVHLVEFPRLSVVRVNAGARSSPELQSALRTVLAASDDYKHVSFDTAALSDRSSEVVIPTRR